MPLLENPVFAAELPQEPAQVTALFAVSQSLERDCIRLYAHSQPCVTAGVYATAESLLQALQEGICPQVVAVDVLLPEAAFQTLLQAEDWCLIDAHEHTFEKRGVHCSFAALEELETFAGVPIPEIETHAESGAKYRLLSIKQYLAVYKASAKDGYRVNIRGKKDAEKITLLETLVRD